MPYVSCLEKRIFLDKNLSNISLYISFLLICLVIVKIIESNFTSIIHYLHVSPNIAFKGNSENTWVHVIPKTEIKLPSVCRIVYYSTSNFNFSAFSMQNCCSKVKAQSK